MDATQQAVFDELASNVERYNWKNEVTSVDAHRSLQDTEVPADPDSLSATFVDCLFESNDNANPTSTTFTMVYLASANQRTVFQNCIFRSNDFGTLFSNEVTQAIVFSNGGSLEFSTACFFDNRIRGFGQVVKLGDAPIVSGTAGNVDPANGLCGFIAAFEESMPGDPLSLPTSCIGFDSTVCTATGFGSTTAAPTVMGSPSAAPSNACIDDLDQILRAELSILDLTARRTYSLCPGTTFATGTIVNQQITGGQNPILLRANMTVQCGFDGSIDNDCMIVGGLGLLANPVNYGDTDQIGLSVVQGIKFVGLTESPLTIIGFDGTVQVKDCVFSGSTAKPNIYLEGGLDTRRRALRGMSRKRFDASDEDRVIRVREDAERATAQLRSNRRQLQDGTSSSDELFVSFEDCRFSGNAVAMAETPGFTIDTLIFLATTSQYTSFSRCVFENNDFGSTLTNPVSLMSETE